MEIDNSSSSSSGLGSTRQRFNIELRPGETTIVSWKKLIKEANNKPGSSTPLAVQPSHLAAATVQQKAQEVQVALDEYFQDEKSTSKSNNFTVNMGKLEHLNEPVSSSDCQLKKRKKHIPKALEEKVDDSVPNKNAKLGHARKVAAKNVALVGQNSTHSQSLIATNEYFHERKLQHLQNSPIGFAKKKPLYTSPKPEYSFYSGISNNDASAVFENSEDTEKQWVGNAQFRNSENNVKSASGFSGATHMKSEEKNASKQLECRAKRILTDTNELESSTNAWQREKNGNSGLPDLNIPASPMESVFSQKSASNLKNVFTLRPKGTTLERAIRELEKVVAQSRPTNVEVQEADTSSITIKRRLPREVKQKLAKVARLAQSSQGKISKELVNRLMSILGHLVQLRTLKRNLREMVLLGLSAKQEKADRIQLIKKEVIEMIQLQASKVSGGAAGNFQEAFHSEEKGFPKEIFCINSMLEDKICDLYDLYIQGMDEDKGPQIRKLYAELAELWPEGAMDNHGIKKAIYRAKERRRALYDDRKVQEKARTRKLPMPRAVEVVRGEVNSMAQPVVVHDRMITETNSHFLGSANMMTASATAFDHNLAAPLRISSPILKGSNMDLPKQEKLERKMNPTLKEKLKQERWDLESKVNKLSLRPYKKSKKSYKRSVSQTNGLSHQLAAPPPS